jgi:hypothetical protein
VKGLPAVADVSAKNKYAKELLYLHDQSKILIEVVYEIIELL